MAPAKRLNLSKSKAEESSASSSSEEDERAAASDEQSDDEEESDEYVGRSLGPHVMTLMLLVYVANISCVCVHLCANREFEIPSGFEPVKGSSAITRDAVLSEDKELWFFKLPKHVRCRYPAYHAHITDSV